MAKFTAPKGKMVMLPNGGIYTFTDEPLETKDKDNIQALKGAIDVAEVKGQARKAEPEE